jgi:vacuolar-type H+-ATPase subunit E/Vma4
MALTDIFEGIVAETDAQIQTAKGAHKERMKSLRAQSDAAVTSKLQAMHEQKELRKRQMRSRMLTHADMTKRNAILAKEQEYMTIFFNHLIEKLANLPKPALEKFYATCFESINAKGTIRPAKPHKEIIEKIAGKHFSIGEPLDIPGGFLFTSETQDRDFTFPFLVQNVLRPKTEIEVAKRLFA